MSNLKWPKATITDDNSSRNKISKCLSFYPEYCEMGRHDLTSLANCHVKLTWAIFLYINNSLKKDKG